MKRNNKRKIASALITEPRLIGKCTSMRNWLYKPLYRPAPFSGLPNGWEFQQCPPDLALQRPDLPVSTWMYGIISYQRPLTDNEVKRHELEFIGIQDS